MGRRYRVLRQGVSDPTVADAVTRVLDALAQADDGVALEWSGEERLEELWRRVWVERGAAADSRCELRLVRDEHAQVWYVALDAPDGPRMDRLSSALTRQFDFYTLVELQQAARQRMLSEPATLTRLAIGAGTKADPATCEVLRAALSGRPADVRARAAEAISIVRWPELLPVARARLAVEDVEAVRRALAVAEAACAGKGGPRPNRRSGGALPRLRDVGPAVPGPIRAKRIR